ncbi:MAG: hypothetical protein HYT94_02040 [Parcubacteria group bacterium]|nr:hypothetical protein [Parcubacteria group bacterium]
MQTTPKKTLSAFSVLLLAGTVIGYGYYRTRDFLAGPVVEITAPKNGQTLTRALIEVQGTSKNISFLNLNGRKIFTDETGKWHEKLLASPGYNRIEVSAKDRFGRDVTKTVEVVLKESER